VTSTRFPWRGKQTITLTDTLNPSLTGSVTIDVL
jgi:hypothetical protein